jgi:cytochrome c553
MTKITLFALAMALSTFAYGAGDAAAGKAKSPVCASCHGAEGCSANPLWPNIAGQKDQYLIKQLKSFRDGTRNDPLMSAMVKPLSDEDIDNLAAFYSAATACQ